MARPSLLHKYAEISGPELHATATAAKPAGPGFSADQVEKAGVNGRMEIWATSYSPTGDDYVEFRLYDGDSNRIATERINGY